jgi:hypothetical protein
LFAWHQILRMGDVNVHHHTLARTCFVV